MQTTPGAYVGRFGDRHFLVVRGDANKFVTARQEPKLLLIQPHVDSENLHLSADNMKPLVIDLNKVEESKNVKRASVHDTDVVGLDCGDEAGAWLDEFLQKPGHHLIFSSPSVDKRSIQTGTNMFQAWTAHVDSSDKMAYQDFSTYNILSEASVDDVRSKIGTSQSTVTAENFRANIVVSDVPAFAEDSWVKIYIGDAEFSPVKLCSRCILTTINPKTAKMSEEPLVSLRRYRKLVPEFGQSPCFGVNIILDKQGTIKVGDEVYAVPGHPKLEP
jgi:uncharacterized protein YcbX